MPKLDKNSRKKNKKKDEAYNAENEIIIGVTTKPKEKVRVEKKSTRTRKSKNIKKSQKNIKNKSKENKEKDKIIRKKNRKKIIISIIILIFIALGGTIYYLTTPAFNISTIIIEGNKINSEDTYTSLSKLVIGETNIFAFTPNGLTKALKENSYVEDVEVKRQFPDTVKINVKERTVDYQIENNNLYVYINNQGYILETNEESKDVPILNGIETVKENFKLGQRLNNNDLIKLDTILKISNYCKYNSVDSKITGIDVADTLNYILNFSEEGKVVYLGDGSSLSERILWLKTILQKTKGKEGEIFINGDLKEDKIFFREK